MAAVMARPFLAVALVTGGAGCGHRPVDYGGVAVMEGSLRRAQSAQHALQRSAAAVAIIETDVARGMGFVVDPSGYLITNRHVIEDADHIEGVVFPARDPSRIYGSVRVVYMDPIHDLALLHVHSSEPLVALPLATAQIEPVSRYLAAEDPVVLVQREAGEDEEPTLALQHGEVSRLDVDNPAAGPGPFVGVSLDVHRGQSGGPVLDRHGRAVGVVTWTWRERGGGYAIPIADATRMLRQRPRLEADDSRRARVELRARAFLDALGRADGEAARRFTSPSQARKQREDTVGRIIADTSEGEGLALMQAFVAALDEVVDEAVAADDPGVAERSLGPVVLGALRPDVRGPVGDGLPLPQVISFFHELGDGYLRARLFAGQPGPEAMQTAMQQLRTLEAARAFGLAALVEPLDGRALEIRAVELMPGAYAPGARVELEAAPSGDRPREIFDLYLRLEWGDFHVTTLERRTLPRPVAAG